MARVSIRMDERSVREFGRRILRMLSAAPTGDLPLDRLVVKSGGSTRFVQVANIDWIAASWKRDVGHHNAEAFRRGQWHGHPFQSIAKAAIRCRLVLGRRPKSGLH